MIWNAWYGCQETPPAGQAWECDARDSVEMIGVEEFLHELRFAAPDAPDDLLRYATVQAAITMAQQSWLLKRSVVIPIEAGVNDYWIEQYPNEAAWRIVRVCAGCQAVPLLVEPCPVAQACGAVVASAEKIVLTGPGWDRQEAILVQYAAQPKRDACKLDRVFYEHYLPEVQAGALAWLLRQRGPADKPYSFYDPVMAREWHEQFVAGCSRAKAFAIAGESSAQLTVTPNAWMQAGM